MSPEGRRFKIEASDLRGKKVLVVGAARSGEAAAELLLKHGAMVTLTDTKPETELESSLSPLRKEGVEVENGGHRLETFLSSELIILSPGVPLKIEPLQEAMRRGIPVISEVELAYHFLKGKVIGVTGSNGKSTTATLIGDVINRGGFRAVVAGNIGNPLCGVVTDEEVDYYVVELSSFQLETIVTFRPHISLLLNITPDHLDRYSSFEDYIKAKERIFENQTDDDYAILNADDPLSQPLIKRLSLNTFLFSRQKRLESRAIFLKGDLMIYQNGEHGEIIKTDEIGIRGSHNLENAMAAAAVGILCGVEPRFIGDALRSFRGLEHRLEYVTTIKGIAFYNDSKATNIGAVYKSLESFPGNIILLLGGRDKGGDFTRLRELVRERVKLILVIGEAKEKIIASLRGAAHLLPCGDMREALETGFSRGEAGDVFLLAPGCTSFDMFANFEERGRIFKQEVNRLHQREGNA
ncbi:MAG: UDP-N-acetylmuramoyl-L-alanine--D-glutamate ligase [Candidatus Aminicenantes bacterium]|nr:UDP-N-acetylmuramoyl-L-alanine--D-glutamate ligase [Candidatus Aminicenantes bacterium]